MKQKYNVKTRLALALGSLLMMSMMGACGGGAAVVTSAPTVIPPSDNTPAPSAVPLAPVLGQTTLNALNLGGDFPADIDIVNIAGLSNIAFITSYSPAAVIAVDLNSNPLQVIAGKGLPSLSGINNVGFPSNLFIADATHAYLLTSTSLIFFNPSDTTVYGSLSLSNPITLTSTLASLNADGSPATPIPAGAFTPTYPASIVAVGSKVLVSFSNLAFSGSSLNRANQGIVEVFDLQGNNLVPSTPPYFTTSGFNTTGLTLLPNGNLLITNTGITQFTSDFNNQVPVSSASVDAANPQTSSLIATLDLGLSTPAFRSWAVSPDGSKAFIGSASGGFVMEISLAPFQVLRGVTNPIVIADGSLGTDFIDDVVMANDGGGIYPMSFNHSSVYAVDLTGSVPQLMSKVVSLAAPGNPGITAAGPGAMRPGQAGVDFNGPSLFVLTGSPGTIAVINTF